MAAKVRKLPNLKICVENTEDVSESEGSESEISVQDEDDFIEEGEIVDSTDESGDEVQFSVSIRDAPSGTKSSFRGEKKYENRSGDFVTGFDITSKEYQERKAQRAKRFGIESEVPAVSKEDLKTLYESLGITEESMRKGERGIRPEAIHLRGTDEMSTQDVFDFFEVYSPGSIEWIDDSSCNVVWLDPMTAARAMINLTKSYLKPFKRKENKKKVTKTEPMDTGEKSKEKSESKEIKQVKKDDDEEEEYDDDLNLMSDDEDKENKALKSSGEGIDKETGELKRRTSDEPMETTEKKQSDDDPSSSESDSESSSDDGDDDDRRRRRRKRSQTPTEDSGSVGRPESESTTGDKEARDDENLEDFEDSDNSETAAPPGKWRVGVKKHPKAKHLYLRFATKADRKQPGAEKRSRYYQRHGNPNYRGIRGLISTSRKRKLRTEERQKQSREARQAIENAKVREEEPKEKRPVFPKSDWLYNVAEELYDDQRLIDLDDPVVDMEKKREESRLQMKELEEQKRSPVVQPESRRLRMDEPKVKQRLPRPIALRDESSESSDDDLDLRIPGLPVRRGGESSEEEDLSLLIPAKKKMTMKMYADVEEEKLSKSSYLSGATNTEDNDDDDGVLDARARIQTLKRERALLSSSPDITRTTSNDLRRKLEGRRKNRSSFKDYPSLVVEVFEADD